MPRTWPGAAGLAILGLACGLTEIQMLLFAPLVLVNLRNRKSIVVAASTLLGIAAQVCSTITFPRSPNSDVKPGMVDIVVGFGELPVLGSLGTDASRLGDALANGGLPATGVVTLLVVGVIAFALLPAYAGRGIRRVLPIALVAGSFISWAAAIWLNPRPWWQYADFDTARLHQLTSTRYVVVPSMLLLAALVFAAAYCFEATRGRFVSGVAVGILALAFMGSYYVDDVARSDGPPWSQAVQKARESCRDGRPAVEIHTMPAGWSVTVPCSSLGAGAAASAGVHDERIR